MTPSAIIAAARRHLKTPFLHQGRVPGLGLDCAGLVVVVAREFGLQPADPMGYGRMPFQGLLQQALENEACIHRIPSAERQPGDILLMRFGRDPQHLAILAGDTIIHSYSVVGEVCEHALDDAWQRRIVAVYRFNEVSA